MQRRGERRERERERERLLVQHGDNCFSLRLKLKVQTYFYKFVFLGPFSFVALSLYGSCNKVSMLLIKEPYCFVSSVIV